MADLLARLSDSTSTEARLAQAAGVGLLTVVLSPGKMPKGLRTAAHLGSAAVGAAGGAYAFPEGSSSTRAAAVAGFAGLLGGLSVLGFAADKGAENWLRKRGVRRPRLLLGVAAAVLAWFTSGPNVAQDAVVPGETPTSY